MDSLSTFLNLIAKTEGRDKVFFYLKLVPSFTSIRHSLIENSKWIVLCCLRSIQNDQKSIEIPPISRVFNQNQKVSPTT